MKTYKITKKYQTSLPETPRTRQIAEIFAIPEIINTRKSIVYDLPVDISPGHIVLITGPSGSGKTSILSELKSQIIHDNYRVCDLTDLTFDKDAPLVDTLDSVSLDAAIKLLSNVGLTEVSLMIDSYNHLSTGQQYRFKIVYALSKKPDVIIADEFCNAIDEIAASVISCNIRNIISNSRVCFVAASVNDSIQEFLLPNTTINKSLATTYTINHYP